MIVECFVGLDTNYQNRHFGQYIQYNHLCDGSKLKRVNTCKSNYMLFIYNLHIVMFIDDISFMQFTK